jgi:hypothetical protein
MAKMSETITTKELEECARLASKRAVDRAKAQKIPYTVQEGKKIVRHTEDGTTTVIQTLPKAYIKINSKHFKII